MTFGNLKIMVDICIIQVVVEMMQKMRKKKPFSNKRWKINLCNVDTEPEKLEMSMPVIYHNANNYITWKKD